MADEELDQQAARPRLRRGIKPIGWFDAAPDVTNAQLIIDHEKLRARSYDIQGRCWRHFAQTVADGVVDYASGELTFESAERACRRCSNTCDRFAENGVGYQMNRITPTTLSRRRPEFPSWVRRVAVTILRVLDEEHPGHLAPGHYTAWTSPTLRVALDWLLTLGVFDAETLITPKTLYGWFNAAGHEAASRRTS